MSGVFDNQKLKTKTNKQKQRNMISATINNGQVHNQS